MKQKITQEDYIKAHRKARRDEEIAQFGKQITHRTRVQKSKKVYDRKVQRAAWKKLLFCFVARIMLYIDSLLPMWNKRSTFALT